MEELREYDLKQVKDVCARLFGPDPLVRDSKDFEELQEYIADDQVEAILEKLSS